MKKTNNIHYLLRLYLLLFLFPIYHCSLANQNLVSNNYYTIPLEFVENAPYLTVTIENKKVPLILDTGASIAIHLRKNILNDLKKLKYTGEYSQTIDVAGKVQRLPYFTLDNVDTFGYKANQVSGVEYEPWGAFVSDEKNDGHDNNTDHKQNEDGVIGLKFFKENNLIIDYSNKRLIVLKPGAIHPEYATKIWHATPLSASKNTLIIESFVEGKLCKFLIDTGSTGSMLKKTLLSKKIQNRKKSFTTNSFLVSGKNFAPLKFWLFDFEDPDFDGFLGYDFFNQHVVYIDIQNNVIKIS